MPTYGHMTKLGSKTFQHYKAQKRTRLDHTIPGGHAVNFILPLAHCRRRTYGVFRQGTTVCRYNWHSAGSPGWPFPMLKYKYIFQTKYAEAIVSNSTGKLLWFEIAETLSQIHGVFQSTGSNASLLFAYASIPFEAATANDGHGFIFFRYFGTFVLCETVLFSSRSL